MVPWWWSVLLAAVGVAGLMIAGRKNYWGWFVGMIAQFLWIAYAYVTGQWGFYLSALAYGWVYADNWWKWRKEHRGKVSKLGHPEVNHDESR
jgi:nicotinamide riboside transporter PnuC